MAGNPPVIDEETSIASIAYPPTTNTVTIRNYDGAALVGDWDWPAKPKRKDSRHKPFWHSLPRNTRNKRR